MKRYLLLATAVWVTFLLATPALAQSDFEVRRFGVRGGLTVDPDQGHVGVHVNAGNFTEDVRFQPSFELGFGSDRIVGMFNIDALYMFDPRPWRPYLGGGIGIGFIDRDRDGRDDRDDDVDVEAGVNLVGGFEWNAGKYLLEARVGIADIPRFKVTVGINF